MQQIFQHFQYINMFMDFYFLANKSSCMFCGERQWNIIFVKTPCDIKRNHQHRNLNKSTHSHVNSAMNQLSGIYRQYGAIWKTIPNLMGAVIIPALLNCSMKFKLEEVAWMKQSY